MATYLHDLPIPERVKALCNELYSQGGKVSVRLVLAQMPDVKSTSTIHKYYAEWKKELSSGQQSLYERLGFSPDFTQSFMKEITRFSVEAENRYKDLAGDADEQRNLAIEDLTRADERLYKQSAVVEQLEKELKMAKTEAAEQSKSVEATLAELRKQIADLSEDNKALLSTNEQLRTDVAKAQLAIEHNEKYVAEVRTNHQSLLEENKTLSSQFVDSKQHLARQEAENSGNQSLIEQLRRSEMTLKDILEKRENEATDLAAELRLMRAELETSQRQEIAMQAKMVILDKQIVESQRTLTEQATVIKLLSEASREKNSGSSISSN